MADSSSKKRQHDSRDDNSGKKNKTNHQWKKNNFQTLTGIELGWQGIFATCDKGRESRAVAEMYSILEECASKLYPDMKKDGEGAADSDDEEEDIESAIKKELADNKDKKKKDTRSIASVKIDTMCVTFFRLKPPLEATGMVRALCESASNPVGGSIRSKFVHRLTPVTRTGKATLEGLREVAAEVLKPHFHSGQEGIKFAIRPTTRNHSILKRDEIIRTIASCVGPSHTVDLKNPDLLILVELYKNVCGMSVVTDFEKLKRFNFGQLQIDASSGGGEDEKREGESKKVVPTVEEVEPKNEEVEPKTKEVEDKKPEE
ncbi:hypothetical protein BZA05DRAFT_391059 [Tricharina praecox]|uniref:uncharacterized protein n=1 Tax=Tricharina praecox TaxID=43433 RepID=UPI00221EA26F|nr:uncharacterized protein BZA05DRAFT_391059 [Tricharina praecox]KAI5855267.1 hypothetical protein BZA05DRAFT_391059 [Tricharina praecox]